MQLSRQTIINILHKFNDEKNWEFCGSYGEPGYGSFMTDTFAVVLGDYWLRRPDGSLMHMEEKYPRLWQALEEAGVSFEWHDEWQIDYDHDKAYRVSPDCYTWQPSLLITDGGEFLTPDDDIQDWIDYVINNHQRALYGNVWSSADLENAGFTQWNGGFESGWHPGQDDKPADVCDAIHAQYPGADIVFRIDHVQQFSCGWEAYYREEEA